jgi:hypothetical protein
MPFSDRLSLSLSKSKSTTSVIRRGKFVDSGPQDRSAPILDPFRHNRTRTTKKRKPVGFLFMESVGVAAYAPPAVNVVDYIAIAV